MRSSPQTVAGEPFCISNDEPMKHVEFWQALQVPYDLPCRMGYRVAWVAYTVPHDACRRIWHSDHPRATPEGPSTHHPLQHYQPSFKIQHLPYRPMWLLACFVELAQYLTNDALKVPRTTRCNTSP